MKTLSVKAVIITNGESYFIHGVSGESAATMLKTMMPLWNVDPATETIHYVEMDVTIPEFENAVKLVNEPDPS